MTAGGGRARPRVALLVNPAADRGAAITAGRLAAAAIGEVASVSVATPEGGADASLARLRHEARRVDAVVVCGGDGIVHLAANVLVGDDVPLGIMPAGSGNDIADVAGMARDPREAARQLRDAIDRRSVRRIDVGRCDGPQLVDGTDRVFVGLLYVGFDSAVNERANRMRRIPGSIRYDLALAVEAARLRSRRCRLTLDGERLELPVTLVAVGNGSQYGGGKRMVPHARWDDGRFGICVIGPVTRRALARFAPRLPHAGHVSHPAVWLREATAVTIDMAGPPAPMVYADGEPIGPTPLRAWVDPAALPVLAVPRAAGDGSFGTMGR